MDRARDGTGQQGQTAPRHVFVRVGDHETPGVLIDWRQVDGEWQGYTFFATTDRGIVYDWVPADRLRVAD